jgi:hypothetical protein
LLEHWNSCLQAKGRGKGGEKEGKRRGRKSVRRRRSSQGWDFLGCRYQRCSPCGSTEPCLLLIADVEAEGGEGGGGCFCFVSFPRATQKAAATAATTSTCHASHCLTIPTSAKKISDLSVDFDRGMRLGSQGPGAVPAGVTSLPPGALPGGKGAGSRGPVPLLLTYSGQCWDDPSTDPYTDSYTDPHSHPQQRAIQFA